MKKNEVIQIRVTPEFKAELKERAGGLSLSAYILGELGDSPSGACSSAAEQRSPKPPVGGSSPPVPVALTKLIKQLEAQGNPDAEEVARKRLGM